MQTLLALAVCLPLLTADPTPADKAIDRAIAELEKAKAGAAKADAAKLAKAISALEAIKNPTTTKVSLGQFIDDPKKFEGQTLTFRLEYSADTPLRDRGGSDRVPFKGVGPKAPKAYLGLKIPRDFDLPAAFDGDELIVTFTRENGENVVKSIRRP